MRNVTLATLITRCQQRADLENDGHIAAGEWKALVSEMYGELQLLVAETGMRYFETEATITANGSASYALPSDHLATIGVDYVQDAAGTRRTLQEIMVQERSAVLGRTGEAFMFAIVGQTLELYPRPSGGTYKHLYIPQPPDLAGASDSADVDVVTPDGEAFLIWGVAVKALAKSESDVRLAMAEREAARERLRNWAQLRSFVTPRRRVGGDDDAIHRDPADWWPRG
jgi:hypothetical protein